MTPEQKEARRAQLAEARAARKSRQEPVKKGTRSWKPAKKLNLVDKVPGYRYRWVDHTDSQNVARKQAEGWEHANNLTGHNPTHDRPAGVDDGKPLDGSYTYRELTLMVLPEELGQARDEYIEAETAKQTAGRARRLQQEVRDAAPSGTTAAAVHQKITVIE